MRGQVALLNLALPALALNNEKKGEHFSWRLFGIRRLNAWMSLVFRVLSSLEQALFFSSAGEAQAHSTMTCEPLSLEKVNRTFHPPVGFEWGLAHPQTDRVGQPNPQDYLTFDDLGSQLNV